MRSRNPRLFPLQWRFFWRRREVSPSPAAWGLASMRSRAEMREGDDVDAVRTRETGLPTRDDAEGGELRQLGLRQPRAELGEIGDGFCDLPP